jgi:hypothetical protein
MSSASVNLQKSDLIVISLFPPTFASFPQYTVNPEKPEEYGRNSFDLLV